MALQVRRADAASIRDDWLRLLDSHDHAAPFLHPTWHDVWSEEFCSGREPLLITAHDAGELAGIAPLLREDERITFAGSHSICDYMDVVHGPDHAGPFAEALVEALLDEEWSELDLRGLRDCSPTLDALTNAASAAGLTVERELEAVAPRVSLPESWDEYLAALSKKQRHELRRKMRRFEAAGDVEFRSYTTPADIGERLPMLLRFMVDSRSDKAAFMSEQMARFFHRMTQAMAGEGLIRLYELELDGRPVAEVLCFDQGGAISLYNSGYDPQYSGRSVGIVSKALCIRDAIESGRRYVDFLRGREPYKYDLGAQDREVFRLRVRRG